MVATPGRPLHVINEETDYDTSSSEGEEESEGGVAQWGVVVPSESEKSDTEQVSGTNHVWVGECVCEVYVSVVCVCVVCAGTTGVCVCG